MKTTTMKKFMASIAALTLSAAIAAPVAMTSFAAPNLTITDSEGGTVNVKGKTFKIYQIATVEEIGTSGTYNYAINSAYEAYFDGLLTTAGVEGVDHTSSRFMEELSKIFEKYEDDDNRALADALAGLSNGEAYKEITIAADGSNNSVDLVAKGYYLVVETTTTPETNVDFVKSAYMLKTLTDDAVEMKIKADKPTIDKKILENGNEVEANNAGYGDTVNFKIKGTIPNMSEYNTYTYIISDTLSAGLTLDESSIKVYIGEKLLEDMNSTNDTHIEVTKNAATGTIEVKWADLKDCYDKHGNEGDAVYVTYSATVNTTATLGEDGNLNTVDLEYSNDPEASGTGTTTKTPPEYTKTYVTDLTIHKTDGAGTANLAGAKFEITSTDGKLKFFAEVGDSGEVLVSSSQLEDGKTWKTGETTGHIIGTTDSNGNLVFKGLPAGTYTIKETQAPTGGYNLLDKDIKVEISWTAPGAGATADIEDPDIKCDWSYVVSGDYSSDDVSDSDGTITVVNRKGSKFPETGGIGTTIFYTVGIAMLAGAGALVVFKRKSDEK